MLLLWKEARIVALRKPSKPDYSKAKAYRPISLLQTISKGLETLVARRLSYLAETHQLLPKNHFGARPKRSAVQALLLVTEKIYNAWRAGKVLSLLSFDVQGAFNRVHLDVLTQRLKERRIPPLLVKWIRNFCRSRRGSIALGGYDSEMADIGHAGVPQGSPLSPILFVFYNASLVEQSINTAGGSIGFVDDYNVWVTGRTIAENLTRLQTEVIPRAS